MLFGDFDYFSKQSKDCLSQFKPPSSHSMSFIPLKIMHKPFWETFIYEDPGRSELSTRQTGLPSDPDYPSIRPSLF